MATVALNKSALQKDRQALRLYERILPSLDLKRRQLIVEHGRAQDAVARQQAALEQLRAQTAAQLPMLANQEIALSGLVQVQSVDLGEENVLGVTLPVLLQVCCSVRPYALLAKPHWVDVLVERLQQATEDHLRLQVAHERLRRLERAVRRTTQRVNLFDKVLIPTAKQRIQRTLIFLADAERAAVVRAKIAKAKHRRQQQGLDPAEGRP
jgi:V/A-type H+-transporting ATPase subunit D